MAKFELKNIGDKTVLRSRTILTILALIANWFFRQFGDMPDFDVKNIIDVVDGLQIGEIVELVLYFAAFYFRKFAKVDLSKPNNG